MEVLGAVVGITSVTVRTTTSKVWTLINTWREAPDGLHRLLDDLRRSQQFLDETETGLRELYLAWGTSPSDDPPDPTSTITAAILTLLEEAVVVIARIETWIEKIHNGDGIDSLSSEGLSKRRKAAWLRRC
ncbi:hypothetical protein QBC35DRAFT_20544 [Podospora australis]|uniref:Uncharacterized protein n=1 Tax=Podospora australis TaxID=1536484 RepID=A0AAN6WNC9_9PEZI|nr:hypothetical protein QBC35DRAFT_20544 [Podospora australis]